MFESALERFCVFLTASARRQTEFSISESLAVSILTFEKSAQASSKSELVWKKPKELTSVTCSLTSTVGISTPITLR